MSSKSIGWALEQGGLSPTEKLVLIAMCDSASDTGLSFSSSATLCRVTGLSRESSISDIQNRLIKSGFIADTNKRTGSTKRVRVFQIHPDGCKHLPDDEILSLFESNGNPTPGAILNPTVIQRESNGNPTRIQRLTDSCYIEGTGNLGTRNVEQSVSPSNDSAVASDSKPKRQKRKKEMPPIPDGLKTPQFLEAWNSLLDHRKEKGSPMTPTGATLALKRFEEWGIIETINNIEHSIRNGWTGVFPRDRKTNSQPTTQLTTEEWAESWKKI